MFIRILKNTDKKCLYKLVWNLGFKGLISLHNYKKRIKKGEFFPAFHFISVTDHCNLKCQGCWIVGKKEKVNMPPEKLDRIISETKAKGSYFFGILGGEPLMYKPLMDILAKHQDCYFQLFTNGTLLTPQIAGKIRKLANVTPLISFEGDREVADVRRGGSDIFRRTTEAIDIAVNEGLFTGVAMSVCKSNLDFAMSPEFINSLIEKKVGYLWYYIYRPMGENPTPELCLDANDIISLRRHMVDARTKYDIVIIDAYWDGNGNPLCPAVTGISHHINASGYIEPCPVIQFSKDFICDNIPLEKIYNKSAFLKELKTEIPKQTQGCIILDDPQWLVEFLKSHEATDTSGRNNEIERLMQMPKVPSHSIAGAIPEKSKLYKFLKNKSFFGMGAYG